MESNASSPIVVVGAGIAGVSAAEAARRRAPGASVVLLSAESDLPYYRLRLCELLDGVSDPSALSLHPGEWYAERGIALRLSCPVASVDPGARRVMLTNGESVPYASLVLAAGSVSFLPPIDGVRLPGVHTLWTLADAMVLRAALPEAKRAVVVGGGLLGLEGAYRMALRGVDVTVVEMLPRLLPNQLDAEASRILESVVRSRGIGVRTGARLLRVEGAGRANGVALDGGEVLPADLVLVAAGVRPNLSAVGGSGVTIGRRIAVDAEMRTNVPGIYAAGDAAEVDGRWEGLWTAARAQGIVAGANAAGGAERVQPGVGPYFLDTMGTRVVSIGAAGAEGPAGAEIRLDEANHVYRRLVFDGSRLVGAVLVGDVAGFQKIAAAVRAAATHDEAKAAGLL